MKGVFVLGCVVGALLLAILGLNVWVLGKSQQASNNTSQLVLDVQHLLLDGKTASAVSAHKTATEVALLLSQQAFDQAQTRLELRSQQSSTKVINEVILRIETHIDKAIRLAALREGRRVLKALEPRLP